MSDCGATFAEIADACGLDSETIEQHFRTCCEVVAAGPEPDSLTASDERLTRLQEKISLAATAGGLQGDLRSQISALSLSLRAELEVRASLQEREKADGDLPSDCRQWTEKQGTQFVAYLDSIVKQATAVARPGSAVDEYGWLCSLEPATLAMFRRIAADLRLLAAAKELEKTQNATVNN